LPARSRSAEKLLASRTVSLCSTTHSTLPDSPKMGVNSTSTCSSRRGAWLQGSARLGSPLTRLAATEQDSPGFVGRPDFADASVQGRRDLLDD